MLLAKVGDSPSETMDQERSAPEEGIEPNTKKEDVSDILPLIQILLKNPPPDYDCRTCPICRRYGITEL